MMHNRLTVISASTAWNTVARFDDCEAAQRAPAAPNEPG